MVNYNLSAHFWVEVPQRPNSIRMFEESLQVFSKRLELFFVNFFLAVNFCANVWEWATFWIEFSVNFIHWFCKFDYRIPFFKNFGQWIFIMWNFFLHEFPQIDRKIWSFALFLYSRTCVHWEIFHLLMQRLIIKSRFIDIVKFALFKANAGESWARNTRICNALVGELFILTGFALSQQMGSDTLRSAFFLAAQETIVEGSTFLHHDIWLNFWLNQQLLGVLRLDTAHSLVGLMVNWLNYGLDHRLNSRLLYRHWLNSRLKAMAIF